MSAEDRYWMYEIVMCRICRVKPVSLESFKLVFYISMAQQNAAHEAKQGG